MYDGKESGNYDIIIEYILDYMVPPRDFSRVIVLCSLLLQYPSSCSTMIRRDHPVVQFRPTGILVARIH